MDLTVALLPNLRVQADIGFNLFNFDSRRPNQPLKKYTFKLFDESMIAPMVSPQARCPFYRLNVRKALFAPHVIRFDLRQQGKQLWAPKESQEDSVELGYATVVSSSLHSHFNRLIDK